MEDQDNELNIPEIDSKYRKILIAAKRSKQIQKGAMPRVKMTNSIKPTRVALEEVERKLVGFEITETVATECNAGLRRVAEEFTDAGIGLCLDDFGSGYANLNTVMRLPFSVIKVDRSLLFDICRDEKRAIFYESVVETFHKMNYHIVSEGVETQEEMEQISSWGVDMIQGYYFSKPLPEKELLELLKKQDNIER